MISVLFIDHYSKVAEDFVRFFMNNAEKPFFTVIETRFKTLMKPILTSKCMKLFTLEKMINFHMTALSTIALTMTEIISKDPKWRTSLDRGIKMGTVVLTDDFNLETFDIENPSQLLRILSWQITQSMEYLKMIFRRPDLILEPLCLTATEHASNMLNKVIGLDMIKDMKKNLEKAIRNNSKKSYIDLLRNEIIGIKKSMEESKEPIEKSKEQFLLYIQMIVVCAYALYCEDIIDEYSKEHDYLIVVHKDFYNYFSSIISHNWKRFSDVIRLYGDVPEIQGEKKFQSETLQSIKRKLADEAAKKILEEEELEKRRKEEAEQKKIEKRKQKQEERKRKEDEIKNQKKILDSVRPIKECFDLVSPLEETIFISKPETVLVPVLSSLKLLKLEIIPDKPNHVKLNPTVSEFKPVRIPPDIYKYIKTDQDLFDELTIFRTNPSWYFQNQNAYLFFVMEFFPYKFSHQEIQSYRTVKNELLPIWQNGINNPDPYIQHMSYCNFHAIEQSLIYSMQY